MRTPHPDLEREVAARGVDYPGVSLVLQLGAPLDSAERRLAEEVQAGARGDDNVRVVRRAGAGAPAARRRRCQLSSALTCGVGEASLGAGDVGKLNGMQKPKR